jgi:predicted RNA-binding protein
MIARQHGLIGVSEQAKVVIHKIATGDIITFYLSRKKVDSPPNDLSQRVRQFRGIARVTGGPFESDNPIWQVRGTEIFPYRRSIEFLSDARTDVGSLIEKLSFVTNTTFWALPLRKGYVEITLNDFETIQKAMKTGSDRRTAGLSSGGRVILWVDAQKT